MTLLLFAALLGQTDPWQHLHVVASINSPSPRDLSIDVTTPGDVPTMCMQLNAPSGVLCTADIRRGAASAQVVISSRGYKTYRANIPRLRFQGDIAKIDLGHVQLAKSELPDIVNVLAGDRGSDRVFELTLRNKLKRDVLIKNVNVSATRQGNGVACSCCPPLAVYRVANKLTVNAGGSGKITASGKYEDIVRGSDMSFPMSATIETFTCDHSTKMNFTLPVSFVIPRDSFSAIRIILPRNFAVTGSRFQFFEPVSHRPVSDSKAKPPITRESGSIEQFTNFRFVLSTGQQDEPDVEATYPSR